MIIVLIHWKIKQKEKDAFLEYWRKKAVVRDRSGLIAEYLSEPAQANMSLVDKLPTWVTWRFGPQNGEADFISYINVGLWRSDEDFHSQVGHLFPKHREKKPFEAYPRERTILYPQDWRVGESKPSTMDSGGVA